jgi:hypothetical protein
MKKAFGTAFLYPNLKLCIATFHFIYSLNTSSTEDEVHEQMYTYIQLYYM